MKKLRILIDVDGIVANTLPYWLSKIARATETKTPEGRLPGVIAQVEDIKEWDLSKCPPLDKVDPKLMFGIKYPYNQHLGPEHKLFGSAMDATLTWGSIYACVKGYAEQLGADAERIKTLQESLKNLRPGELPYIPFRDEKY